mmetsp:Transcript_37206/g.92573  ORF Transcript_37206/g.92573 Transcript_37206/m.92573 type:complete len:308 (-) Transcript_37206:361-1284(-)
MLLRVGTKTDVAELRREVGVHERLKFAHILQAFGAATLDPSRLYLVLELASRSLHDLLHDLSTPLTPATAARIGKEVASGLAYIHSRGVHHRDLKSANVLIMKGGDCKLTDFGLARIKEATRATRLQTGGRSDVGTLPWMAPELHDHRKREVDILWDRADAYAFAMVLYELLSRKTPWDGLRESQIISALMMMQGERPELPARVVAELAPVEALMRELWADAPMARPAVDGACVARLVAMLDACTDAERRAAAQATAQVEKACRQAADAQAGAGVVARKQAQHAAGARALEALAARRPCRRCSPQMF